ncbi:hypothetical protein [Cellvibrio sp. pealriver]|uniref:hypothetical protein n=1 Tax=Cellvibrio sp. pealriver TaxID=1622269 RepID=UPI00066FD2A0|nr:hypothetical protein [Cellvibrio sp. pealriver]
MSSPHDMAMLLQYFIGSKRDSLSINQTLISRMEKPGSTLGAQQGMKTGYGLGSYTSSHVNSPVIFHGHRGTIPGSLAEFFYSAEINAGYAFMMNDMNPAYTKISALIRNYLLEQHSASKTKKLEKTRRNDEKNIHIKSSLAGIYAPISPSSSYASFGEQLFGMIEIRNDEKQWLQRPLFGGSTIFYTPISDQLFINKETGLDGMIVINDPIKGEILEINGHTGNSAYQKVSPLRAYGQWIVIFLIITSFIIFFISFPISGLRKLLCNSVNSALSAITLSILSPLTLIAYYYLSNMIPYNMQMFGKPSLLSISLLLVSLIWPIMIGYTIYRYFLTPLYQINIFLRVNSAILFSSQGALCIIMLNYGLIAIPTWL